VAAESADEIQRLFRNSFQIWQSENAELEAMVPRAGVPIMTFYLI
jgi:hypothetical protein